MSSEQPDAGADVQALTEVIYRNRFAARVERTHREHGGGVAAAHWNFVMKESRRLAEALVDDLSDRES